MEPEFRRILILPSWYPPDGGYFFKEHSEAILHAGWKVDVLVNRTVGVRKLMDAGLPALSGFRTRDENGLRVTRSVYLKIPGSERLNIRRWAKSTLRMYARYQSRFGKPALILVHSVTWGGYAASLIREKYGVPYVVVEHRSFFVWNTEKARRMVRPYYIPFFEAGYRGCEKLVLVSESLMNGMRTLVPWVEEKSVVIPNMIREEMFRPSSPASREAPSGSAGGGDPSKPASGEALSRSAGGGDPSEPASGEALSKSAGGGDPFLFFWAGRLEHVKGLDLLLDSFSQLAMGHEGRIRLRLAGKGSLREELERRSASLGLSPYVTFLGRISREQMREELQRAHCFVLPSRYEAFGAVLIEAMATGLPVIATRSGGPEGIVTEKTGILVEPEDPGGLAEAMKQMIDTIHRYTPEEIRKITLDTYGEKAVMAQYNRLFRQCISAKE